MDFRNWGRRLSSVALLVLVWAGAGMSAAPPRPLGQVEPTESVHPLLWQQSMNVFRRFSVDLPKMIEFYGDVLGLRFSRTFNLGRGTMTWFEVGTTVVKLTTVVPNRRYESGPVQDVIGLRLFTLFFPDEAALSVRFREHGYPEPQFRSEGIKRIALVQDPDGQYVELVVVPGAPEATFDQIEVGITVSDLEQSRAFYGDFLGLEALEPVYDQTVGATKYPYRHGTTTVNLWTFGNQLPVDTGSAGIQYVVWNVDGVDRLAAERRVQVDTPLGGSDTLRTLWLADPDGVTNYFAETRQAREAGGPAL